MAGIPKNSVLNFSTFRMIDGYRFWDPLDFPEITPQPDDTLYRVKDTDTIELLAHDNYGRTTLWRIIAHANNIDRIPSGLIPGTEIRIPSMRYVEELFRSKKRRRR